jgi:HK97 family phage major capsid protein/HK97 family phage prohead protease
VSDRAYALFVVKGLDLERRTFSGLATTPELDRQGQRVDPAGVSFRNPLPLLFHHDQQRPIGRVTLFPATAAGIAFEASMPVLTDPGPLKDRIDEAWQSIKAGLITGVSIGLRVLKTADRARDGILEILQSEILELSLVTIPANVQASILSVKSLAASGPHSSGVTDTSQYDRAKVRIPMATITEQISAFEASRAAKAARMVALMTTASEAGVTLDASQADEYESLSRDVKSTDDHLTRFRELERLQVTTATAIPTSMASVQDARTFATNRNNPVVSVKPNVPPGTAFVRAACARLLERTGQIRDAVDYAAKRWDDSTPEVSLYLKAAVGPGTSTDATWAGPLVTQGIAKDFIELLRPATILGKVPGLRMVPFNTKVPSQSAGGTYGWVGEAKPKPVTKLAFASTSLGVAKAAGIIVLTKELIMLSEPSAEDLVRKDMIAGIAQFLDAQFIDPAVAAVAGVNPASITNGAPTAAATTNPMADIMGLIAHFATNNIAVDGVTFIMSAANALALSFRSNLDGSPQYPGVTVNGGTYKGLTFITSQAAGTNVIALQPSLVLYADGGIEIDASQEASLQMDSAPMSPADATTVYVSLWQTNSVGLRAERFCNWAKANANAVKYLTATAWPAPTGTTGLAAENGGAARGKQG